MRGAMMASRRRCAIVHATRLPRRQALPCNALLRLACPVLFFSARARRVVPGVHRLFRRRNSTRFDAG